MTMSLSHSERIAQFTAAMDKANVDWQMAIYGGARHSFTNPNAGRYGIENVAYNKQADRRSWRLMQQFFDEIFSELKGKADSVNDYAI